MAEGPTAGFDPAKHLMKLKGKDYLEVKWRLVWFREQYPHGVITSAIHAISQDHAIVTARVEDGEGGVGSGIGSESVKDFGDFIEKAETKAIGRALAALGFGTQFAPELDEGERIVDSPVNRSNQRQDEPQQIGGRPAAAPQRSGNGGATEKQIGAIYGISKSLGWSKDQLVEWLSGTPPEELDGRSASDVIGDLNKVKEQGRSKSNADDVNAALASATPTSLPFDVPDDRYTR